MIYFSEEQVIYFKNQSKHDTCSSVDILRDDEGSIPHTSKYGNLADFLNANQDIYTGENPALFRNKLLIQIFIRQLHNWEKIIKAEPKKNFERYSKEV